jgi:hypothetical protein
MPQDFGFSGSYIKLHHATGINGRLLHPLVFLNFLLLYRCSKSYGIYREPAPPLHLARPVGH